MKHFTTHFLVCLLSALMSGGTAKAQTYYSTNGTAIAHVSDLRTGYYLVSVWSRQAEGLLCWSGSGDGTNFSVISTTINGKTNQLLDLTNSDDNVLVWKIEVGDDGNFTIMSVSSNQYVSTSNIGSVRNDASFVNVTNVDASSTDNIAKFSIKAPTGVQNTQEEIDIDGNTHFIAQLKNATYGNSSNSAAYLHTQGSGLGTESTNVHLAYYKGYNTTLGNVSCNKIAFFPLSEAVSMTYNYKMDGNSVKTETVAGIIDTEFPAITLPSYCTGSKPGGTITADDEGTTKDIDVSWNGPFTFTETTDNAYWYQMKGAAAQAVVRNAGDNTDIPLKNEGLTTEERTFTYSTKEHWAFVGDPFNGFKIYNRYQQNNTYGRLVASTTMSGSNGGGTIARVSYTTPLADGMTELWSIYNPTDLSTTITIDNGFFIGEHGHPTYIMNSRDNKMSFWTTGKGNGSAFTVRQNELPAISLTKIEGKTYGTFYIDYPILMPEGVEVYTGTADVENGKVLMNNATDRVIPAKTGVVLVGTIPDGTAEEATSVTYPMSISNTAGEVEKGIISGTLETLEMGGFNDLYLVFGRSSATNKLGFYKPSSSLSSIPANKAYIDSRTFTSTGSSVQGLALNFDGGTETGITFNQLLAPEAQSAETVYDLCGRRVSTLAKGCYIRNGKKVYIK
ncbi:MAG: hypothetical protein PUC38_08000 [Bacteroidales bacterium]|nr:hypothetical protein [Bacteroidales bacterium]